MASGYCPVCQRLVGISPGDRQSPHYSSRWWLVDLHARDGVICPGSGARI